MTDTPAGDLRLFFAIFPPPAVAARLAEAAAAIQPRCGGRIARAANLHLTLAFLGRATPEQAEELAALTRATAAPDGAFTLDRYGAFPGAHAVWAGPDPDSAGAGQLRELADGLWRRLRPLGWPGPDVSPLRPHVTLLHKAERLAVDGLALAPLRWRHRGYALAASQPGPEGSVYRILARTAQGAAQN